jgi:death-on-curing protein
VTDVEHLDLEDLLRLVRLLSVGPVRDVGLLDSAANRPRSIAFGQDAYPSLAHKAAALLHSLARNHALVDGNKRLAWLATVVLLDLNRSAPDLTDEEAFDLVVDVAAGRILVDEIAERLKVRHREPGTAGSPSSRHQSWPGST